MSEALLKVRNLKKSYGNHQVLHGVSFDVPKGSIVGLLGPNGCGKSSMIKVIVGLINDYEGEVLINGQKPGVESKKVVAYLPERNYLAPWMTPKQAINYMADFYKNFNKEKAIAMAQTFDLDLKQKIKTMSKGQQEKLQLLLVMCRNARIYILDEPMGGVDPAARDFILETILKNRPEGSTILMSTHLIQDVEEIFDSILMIRQGQIRIQDSVENLTKDGKTINDLFKEVFSVDWNF